MGSRRLPHASVLIGGFLIYAAANSVVPLAQELRQATGMSRQGGAGVFLVPFAAGFTVGVPVWFAVARAWRPTRIMTVSIAGVGAAGLLFALAETTTLAVGARVVLGIMAAGFPPAAQAFVVDQTAANRRGAALSAFVGAVVLGSFGGQAIAGGLAGAISPRASVAILCAGAPAVLTFSLLRLDRQQRSSVSRSRPSPHVAAAGLLVSSIWPVLVVGSLAFGGYWMLLSELPHTLRSDRFSLTAAEAGLVPLLGVLGAAGAAISGRSVDRLGQRVPMVTVLSLGVAGLLLTALSRHMLLLFVAGYGVFLIAYWSYMPPASAEIAARTAPGADRQSALMLFYASMWLGAAVTPVIGPALGEWSAVAVAAIIAWAVAILIAASQFRTSGVAGGQRTVT